MKEFSKILKGLVASLCLFSTLTPVLAEGEEVEVTDESAEVNVQDDSITEESTDVSTQDDAVEVEYKEGFSIINYDSTFPGGYTYLAEFNNTFVLNQGSSYSFIYKGHYSDFDFNNWFNKFETCSLFRMLRGGSDSWQDDDGQYSVLTGVDITASTLGAATLEVAPGISKKFIVDDGSLSDKVEIAYNAITDLTVSSSLTDSEIQEYVIKTARDALTNAGVDPDAYYFYLKLTERTDPTDTEDGKASYYLAVATGSGMSVGDALINITLTKDTQVTPEEKGDDSSSTTTSGTDSNTPSNTTANNTVNKKASNTPATSDTNNVLLYSVVCGITIVAGLAFVVLRKKFN